MECDATSSPSSWRTSSRRKVKIHDGSGQPDSVDYQEEANSENFVMGSDAAEFVNKVKDQVRKRQKRMSNVADSGEEHSIIWRMFMAATMNAATFMGKNFSGIQNSIMNSRDLTLKQMFDITLNSLVREGKSDYRRRRSRVNMHAFCHEDIGHVVGVNTVWGRNPVGEWQPVYWKHSMRSVSTPTHNFQVRHSR